MKRFSRPFVAVAVAVMALSAHAAAGHPGLETDVPLPPPPAGTPTTPYPTGDPAVVGQWDRPFPLPVQAEAAAVLPTGKVLLFITNSSPSLWDPATGATKTVPLDDELSINCAGVAFLPDGRLLVNGGHQGDTPWKGHRGTFAFDPWTETWARLADMHEGRYYPGTIALADGRALTVNGNDDQGVDPGTTEIFDGASWAAPVAAPPMEFYPRMHVLPSGDVVRVGQDAEAAFFDPVAGSWRAGPRSSSGMRWGGISVILPGLDRVLVAGGSNFGLSSEGHGQVPALRDGPDRIADNGVAAASDGPNGATAAAEILDLSGGQAAYRSAAPMHLPRRDFAGVALADGDVLVLGGAAGVEPVPGWGDYSFHPELFDSESESWKLMAPAERTRGYHSTGLLLPDGRVLFAGGDFEQTRDTTAAPLTNTGEIYSPPYLFRGPRPLIAAAPRAVSYGERFLVRSSGAPVRGAALVRLGSATHSLNTDQRWVGLDAQVAGGAVHLHAPATGAIAPPGYYMLFLLSDAGVPSVSSIVKVG
ncbi:MAG TPA: galactose oxidase early set domain-containing protein [Acidimicrobiales bacterium]